jgi:hypothetical protein
MADENFHNVFAKNLVGKYCDFIQDRQKFPKNQFTPPHSPRLTRALFIQPSLLAQVDEHRVKNAVHEAAAFFGAVFLGDCDGFVDGDLLLSFVTQAPHAQQITATIFERAREVYQLIARERPGNCTYSQGR